MGRNAPRHGRPHSMQLDLFRGLAALLMIFNHAGYAWLAPVDLEAGFSGNLVFAGSLAPALFFFATGAGMGLGGRRESVDAAVWRKAGLLVAADLLMNWGAGRWWGLDFFGFTAISMLAVAWVRVGRRPIITAGVLIAGLLVLRYGLPQGLKDAVKDHVVLLYASGIAGQTGVSYPLSPWLTLPLAGFLWSFTGAVGPSGQRRRLFGLAGLAVVGLLAAWVMSSHGSALFRWGTVSAAYYVFLAGAVAALWLLSGLMARWPISGLRFLCLRGPASLLIVPLHYALIEWVRLHLTAPLTGGWWVLATGLASVVALACARALSATLSTWASSATGWRDAFWLGLSFVAVAATAVWAPPLVRLTVACLGQVVVAWRLTCQKERNQPLPSPSGQRL